MASEILALDLGGTHTRVARVAMDGSIVRRLRIETPVADPEPTALANLINEMKVESDATRIVIGVPGIVDNELQQIETGANLPPSWLGYLTADWFAARTGLSVSLANDADLAAVGESAFGAGASFGDTVYVTISTGVGAGMVLGRRLVGGRHSGAEIGHCVIDLVAAKNGRPCTVEDIGSGTAIVREAKRSGIEATGAAFADLVRAGDPTATIIWERAMEAVGIGIVNLCWVATPEVVVVGGGVGMNHDLSLPILRRVLDDHGPQIQAVEIVTASLGDDAALAGAAGWWQAMGRGT
ncbi:MAG: ROK family protein [Acidimicrobiales bacterium]